MKIWSRLVVAAVGFGVMLLAYSRRPEPDARSPWGQGLIAIGSGESASKDLPGRTIVTRLRLLPGNERTEALLAVLKKTASAELANLELQLKVRLIELSLDDAGIGTDAIDAGRLPMAGRDEVLAGASALVGERLRAGDRTLKVVGVLRPGLALLAGCHLIPPSAATNDLFTEGDASVRRATLVGLTREQAKDRHLLRRLEKAFPSPKYMIVTPATRLGRDAYYLYLTGQAALLLGGSGLLIALYGWLAARVPPGWLAAPLQEIQRWLRLLWATHLAYYALVFLGAMVVYELPEVQMVLMTAVREQFGGESGPLSAAGRAYSSGSIPRAATVTFLINFLLGTVATITLPSMMVPGIGTLLAAFRGYSWGILLGPTFVMTAWAMLPHSFTMLLEGEGYILATFFALLIPIYLFAPGHRYGHALVLNLQGMTWVALILAVAAVYEATELIVMSLYV
jgi:hypothetical protein